VVERLKHPAKDVRVDRAKPQRRPVSGQVDHSVAFAERAGMRIRWWEVENTKKQQDQDIIQEEKWYTTLQKQKN